jgi:hypothetical protein
MKTWSGSDVDPTGRRLRIVLGWISCIIQPWFWLEWYRIRKKNS